MINKRTARTALISTILTIGTIAGAGTAYAGDRDAEVGPTIIGGSPADQTYTFMASLQWEQDGNPNHHRCGGALIDPEWVLTAAHCVVTAGENGEPYTLLDPELFHLRIGSTDRTSGGTVATLQDIEVYPDYQWLPDRELGKDIALLHLDRPVEVAPVWVADDLADPGTAVRQLGWGYTSNEDTDDPANLPTHLQQLDTTLLSPESTECQVDDSGDGSWGVREGDLCADNPDGVRGPCYGDSGSPLIQSVGHRWQVVGVDSRSVGPVCGESPEIFTSTGAFRDWIDSLVR